MYTRAMAHTWKLTFRVLVSIFSIMPHLKMCSKGLLWLSQRQAGEPSLLVSSRLARAAYCLKKKC